jgi:type II secretory pathway pseudopilin PulG
MMTRPRLKAPHAFSFVEAIFTIAIIGIMSAMAISAISNGARDANRIVARQQQAALQEALIAWVMSQNRVKNVAGQETAQVRSLNSIRNNYNTAYPTTSARFNLIAPDISSSDPNIRNGLIDKTTADHFREYSVGTDRLQTAALKGNYQYLRLPDWQHGGFPTVELVNE